MILGTVYTVLCVYCIHVIMMIALQCLLLSMSWCESWVSCVLIPVQACQCYKPVSTSHHEGTATDSAVLIVLAKPIKLTPQHSDNNNKSKPKDNC